MVQRITIRASQKKGDIVELTANQSHYLRRVLRLGVGDRFIAQDGLGAQWFATLSEDPTVAHVVEVVAAAQQVLPTAPLRLIAALPKGNSFDQVVRQATELGVSHIYPVISDRTLLKPKGNRLERWRRISQEASEQSERITVPEIFSPMPVNMCLQQANWKGLRYLCAARQNSPHLLAKLQDDLTSENLLDVTLMVGPEGGWTADEITVAIQQEYKTVTLGSVILRSVTASITALSLVAAARELLI
ncbi:MAG: 16S rRNA (uracil(1498)-N(3))-methyltransferase [Cyanobacteria bacterium P01_D01_bin.36]